jgi:hypothetical protein
MLPIALIRLTLESVVKDIPHDAAAFVTYLLFGLFIFFVVVGGRASSPPEPTSTSDAPEPGRAPERKASTGPVGRSR